MNTDKHRFFEGDRSISAISLSTIEFLWKVLFYLRLSVFICGFPLVFFHRRERLWII